MTKLEKIQDLLGDVENDVRNGVISDIVDTLEDFLTSAPEHEKEGMFAAIGIIKANHPQL